MVASALGVGVGVGVEGAAASSDWKRRSVPVDSSVAANGVANATIVTRWPASAASNSRARVDSARARVTATLSARSINPSAIDAISDPIAAMNSDDPAHQVVVAAGLEAGSAHHFEQGLLIRMAPDRFGQVAVAIGIARDHASEPGQDVERISIVETAQHRYHGRREFEYQQLTAGLEYTSHRCQRRRLVGHIAQTEADGDAVKAGV